MLCASPVLNASVPGECLQSLMESNEKHIGLIYLGSMRQREKKALAFSVIDRMSEEGG